MRQIGLRVEILFNVLFLTAVAMFLTGIIAFKITENSALQGKIEGAKSIIAAFESLYNRDGDARNEFDSLRDVLEPGTWIVISDRQKTSAFHTDSDQPLKSITDPIILEVMKTGETIVDVEGTNMPPFTFYKGFKIASPLKKGGRREGVILLYQPLSSLEKNIILGQGLIAVSIIMDLIVIALFGFYILSRRVIKPVHELIRTTEDIGRGKFPSKTNLGGVREINQLNSALKKMYDEIEISKTKLKGNIQALEESNQALLRTQRELIASEKLASLGKLSAGVAHEIGNPLSAIRGYVEVLKKGYMLPDKERTEFLNSIEKEIERIDRIIRTLLDYSRPRGFELKRVDVNDVIRDAAEIVKTQGLLKSIDLKLELSPGLSPIEVDPHQLSQVFINLILNAKDAIIHDGTITISSYKTPDDGIGVAIKDNGAGIPREIIDKIFDPFFTTKEPGKGTGLGLSVSQRIVHFFGGRIYVESEIGNGSAFKINFPGIKNNGSRKGSNN
jgi:two-component system NtrC family sensor kinase